MSQENDEVVRRAYEAFNRGDLEGTVADAVPDFEYVATGTIPGIGSVNLGPSSPADGHGTPLSWQRAPFRSRRTATRHRVAARSSTGGRSTTRFCRRACGASASPPPAPAPLGSRASVACVPRLGSFGRAGIPDGATLLRVNATAQRRSRTLRDSVRRQLRLLRGPLREPQLLARSHPRAELLPRGALPPHETTKRRGRDGGGTTLPQRIVPPMRPNALVAQKLLE